MRTTHFHHADTLHSRSVGGVVLHGRVDVPALPARLRADCARECSIHLAPGDVEALNLFRARLRWPGYRQWVQAAADGLVALGLPGVLADGEAHLMACRGARYHHDGALYSGMAFCNLFLSEDRGLDVHFPGTGQRIPLQRGTLLVFDTCQPHAVIDRQRNGFGAADFPPERDASQLFLTWELPIVQADVARALGIAFDPAPVGPPAAGPGDVCPHTGRWLEGDFAALQKECYDPASEYRAMEQPGSSLGS